jgi:hypothetical protein
MGTSVVREKKRLKGSGYKLILMLMKRLDEPAAETHAGWLAMKKEELDDPENPFKGLPPANTEFAGRRWRHRELTPAHCEHIGIKPDPEDTRDVYHNWYMPYNELIKVDPFAVALNASWAWSILNVLARRLGPDASIAELETTCRNIVDPKSSLDFEILRELSDTIHVCWGAMRLAKGERFPDNPDLQPYHSLEGKIAGLDEYGSLPVIHWIIRNCESESQE